MSRPTSRTRFWIGAVLSGLAVLFLLFDVTIKFLAPPEVISGTTDLGYSASVIPLLAWLLLISVVLYVAPPTSVLGALLLTGYLGGAIATHVRVGNPLFSHVLFPVYVALFVWGGLYLREPRLAVLLPLRR